MSRRWLIALGLLIVAAPAQAEVIKMGATLSAANEVPPIQSPASGMADVTLDTETRELRWEVTAEKLSGPITAAHFHGPSPATQNAGVVVPIAKAGDPLPFKGSATLTPEQMAGLLDGHWYVNVHTANHPPGEIRGQVVRK